MLPYFTKELHIKYPSVFIHVRPTLGTKRMAVKEHI